MSFDIDAALTQVRQGTYQAPTVAGAPPASAPATAAPATPDPASPPPFDVDSALTQVRKGTYVAPVDASKPPQVTPVPSIGTDDLGRPIYDMNTKQGAAANATIADTTARTIEKVGEGATMGLLPHIVAGVKAWGSSVPPELGGTLTSDGDLAQSQQDYQKALDAQRQYTAETSKMAPGASMIAEGAGSMIPFMATSGLVNPLEMGIAKGGSWLGKEVTKDGVTSLVPRLGSRVAANAGVNAGFGVADAATHDIGSGNTQDIPWDMLVGGGLGAGFGAAAPVVGALAAKGKEFYELLGDKGLGFKIKLPTEGGNADYIAPSGTVRATPQQLASATGKLDDAATAGLTTNPGVTTTDAADHVFGVANTPIKGDVSIPGYDRTTAQQTEAGFQSGQGKNAGLQQLDSAYRNSEKYGPRFAALAHDQQSSLTDTLANPGELPPVGVGPTGDITYGDPYAVGQEFTHQLDLMHQNQAADLASQKAVVGQNVDALGQPPSATESGTTMKAAIDQQHAPQQAAADQAVADAQAARDQATAATPAGKQPIPGGATVAEQYGAEGRAQALIGQKTSSDNVSRLYDIVGNPDTATTGLKAEVGSVYDRMPASAAQPKGEEAAIQKVISQYPDNVPLSELTALRERINDEISREVTAAGTTTTGPAKRLLATKSAIDNAINEPLAARAATEQKAVQAGQMAPQETMQARLQAERDAWQAQRGQGAPQGASTATNTPMTPEDAAALQTAREASGKHAQTYQSGAVGDIMETGEHASSAKGLVPADVTRAKGGFKTPDADVMARVWNGKDTEAANLRAAQDAGITPELLKAHAADDLRAAAVDENGEFDPKAYAKWRRNHAAGLHIFPEVKTAFDGMEKAQATLAAARENATATAAAHPLAGITDPANVPDKYMMRGDQGAAQTRQFVHDSGGDPAALQAYDDSFVRKMQSVPSLIKSDGTVDARKLAKLTNDYSGVLSERPELAGKLKDVATAQDEYDRVMGQHAMQIRAYQNGVAKQFLGGLDPEAAVAKVFNGPNSEAKFRELVDMTKANPDAASGLQLAVAKYMVTQARGAGMTNGGVDFLKVKDLQDWIGRNKQTLLDVFGNGQALNNISQVMKELRIQANLEDAAKHSATSKQTMFNGQKADNGNHDAMSAGGMLAGGLIGRLFHGVIPGGEEGAMLVGGTIKGLMRMFRQAGLKTKDDLLATMLVSPETTQAWRAMVARQKSQSITPLEVRRYVTSVIRSVPTVGHSIPSYVGGLVSSGGSGRSP